MNDQNESIPTKAVAALERGSMIEAIKITREKTGLGLKESKEAVDAYLRKNPASKGRFKSETSSGGRMMLFILLAAAAVLAYLFLTGKL